MTTSAPSASSTMAPSASPAAIIQCRLSDTVGWNLASPKGAPFPQRTTCETSKTAATITTTFPFYDGTTEPCYASNHTCVSASFNYSGSVTPFYLAGGCVSNEPDQLQILEKALANECLQIEACKNFNINGTGAPANGFQYCNTNDCNNCTDFGAAGVVGPSLLLFATMVGGLASFFSF